MSRLEVAVALCCAALLVGDAHAWTRPLARGAPAYRHASRRAGSAPMMVESVEERSIAATASAAAVAANAVARAVTARETSAPSLNANSFVAVDDGNDDDALRALGFGERTINAKNSAGGLYEPGGLPRVYDRTAIEAYWAAEKGELRRRWTEARVDMEALGPTYIKLGQMMSVRPDVLPSEVLAELATLQDSVEPFDSDIAREMITKELGGPSIDDVFSELSAEPVAAASLAQVYRGVLRATGDVVAVKVQRPAVLEVGFRQE